MIWFFPFLYVYLNLNWIHANLNKNKHAIYSIPGTELVHPPKGFVALTFDDGPHQILTPRLLDILKVKNVSATFFVMGIKVNMHPDIIKRQYEEGHEIGNHVWNHPVLSRLKYEDVTYQLQITNSAILNATKDYVPKVMRVPYGNSNPKLNDFIRRSENLTSIMWSLDTNDWKRPKPQEIVSKTLQRIKSGDIILCHDIHPGTIEAMPFLIDGLLEQGYMLVTVSKLIQSEHIPLK